MEPTGSNSVFHVSNLENSISFYTEKLGFNIDFKFGEPPTYAGLSLGSVCLHISSAYPYKNNTGHGNLYVMFNEVDDIYNKLVSADVSFYSPIEDREYGMRDFAIKDPDGNQIGIGAEIR
jgi:uncharacterized glyoxalase superfamily protein PhnB